MLMQMLLLLLSFPSRRLLVEAAGEQSNFWYVLILRKIFSQANTQSLHRSTDFDKMEKVFLEQEDISQSILHSQYVIDANDEKSI